LASFRHWQGVNARSRPFAGSLSDLRRNLTMAKKSSEFLKGAGKMWAIMMAIVNAVLEMGGNDEDLHRLLTDSTLAHKVAEVIMSSRQKVKETYKVVVDYGKSLAQMIEAGDYGWFNDSINDKNFPLQGVGQHEVELVLVHLNRNATTKEVLEYLDNQGLIPAKIEHLLAFGVAYPEIQKEFPVVALGSVWVGVNGSRNYPCLDCDDDQRKLDLIWYGGDYPWGGTCRFLALRK